MGKSWPVDIDLLMMSLTACAQVTRPFPPDFPPVFLPAIFSPHD